MLDYIMMNYIIIVLFIYNYIGINISFILELNKYKLYNEYIAII